MFLDVGRRDRLEARVGWPAAGLVSTGESSPIGDITSGQKRIGLFGQWSRRSTEFIGNQIDIYFAVILIERWLPSGLKARHRLRAEISVVRYHKRVVRL